MLFAQVAANPAAILASFPTLPSHATACLANSTTNRRQVSAKLTFKSFESNSLPLWILWYFTSYSLSVAEAEA